MIFLNLKVSSAQFFFSDNIDQHFFQKYAHAIGILAQCGLFKDLFWFGLFLWIWIWAFFWFSFFLFLYEIVRHSWRQIFALFSLPVAAQMFMHLDNSVSEWPYLLKLILVIFCKSFFLEKVVLFPLWLLLLQVCQRFVRFHFLFVTFWSQTWLWDLSFSHFGFFLFVEWILLFESWVPLFKF